MAMQLLLLLRLIVGVAAGAVAQRRHLAAHYRAADNGRGYAKCPAIEREPSPKQQDADARADVDADADVAGAAVDARA